MEHGLSLTPHDIKLSRNYFPSYLVETTNWEELAPHITGKKAPIWVDGYRPCYFEHEGYSVDCHLERVAPGSLTYSRNEGALKTLEGAGVPVALFKDRCAPSASIPVLLPGDLGAFSCRRSLGAVGCLWDGVVYPSNQTPCLYERLAHKRASLQREREIKTRHQRLRPLDIEAFDKEEHLIHGVSRLVGVLLGQAPPATDFKIALAYRNLEEKGLPQVAVRFQDEITTELALPPLSYHWVRIRSKDDSGSVKRASFAKEALKARLSAELGERISWSEDVYRIAHRYEGEECLVQILSLPTPDLERAATIMRGYFDGRGEWKKGEVGV